MVSYLSFSALDGGGYGFLPRPPSAHSSAHRAVPDAVPSAPFGEMPCFAINSNESAVSFVAALLNRVRPLAIFRPVILFAFIAFAARVIPVDIYPINRVRFCWRRSHFFKKKQKIIEALASLYTPPAVIAKLLSFRIVASSAHIEPSPVYFCSLKIVPPMSGRCSFFLQAPTRLSFSFVKLDGAYTRHRPTITKAPPNHAVPTIPSNNMLNDQAPKALAHKILKSSIFRNSSVWYIRDSHRDAPTSLVVRNAVRVATRSAFRPYTPKIENNANDNRSSVEEAA